MALLKEPIENSQVYEIIARMRFKNIKCAKFFCLPQLFADHLLGYAVDFERQWFPYLKLHGEIGDGKCKTDKVVDIQYWINFRRILNYQTRLGET